MNIGDYVRTDEGLIGKVAKKEVYDTHIILEYEGQYCKRVLSQTGTDSEVIKSSPNIIDLIEEGDYVNGERVIALEKDVDKRNIYPSNLGAKIFTDYELQGNWYFGIQEENIKSIVTKEQFESMEYKL